MAEAISAVRRSYRELVDGTLRVQFDIEPMYKKDFLSLFPDVDMIAAIAPLMVENVPRETADYGQFYKNLYLSNFLLQPVVLQQLGTDDDFRGWIQTQKCIVCQKQDYVEETGESKCEAAHVRRADAFGLNYKADFACVPLCRQHHGLQHLKGESAVGGRAFMEKSRDKYLRQWAWQQLKQKFETESMSNIDPVRFDEWVNENGLNAWLP